MKRNKILIMILGIAIVSGIACSGFIIAKGIQEGKTSSSDTSSLKKQKYPEAWKLEKTKLDEFSEISIALDYGNISILPSDDYYLEYRLDGTCNEPEYGISNGKFHFQEGSLQNQYKLSFHLFDTPSSKESYYVTLYVPKEKYFDLLTLACDSGNADLEQLNTKKAELTLDYGNLKLGSFTGDTLSIDADSGNVELKTVDCTDLTISAEYGNVTGDTFTVSHKADLKLDSGNLVFSQLTADTLSLNNEYGSCTVDSITIKKGDISLDSGDLELKNAVLGTTTIDSEYGNTAITLASKTSDYNYDLKAEYGSIQLDGKEIGKNEDDEAIYQKTDSKRTDLIRIHCDSGNIDIK